MLLSFMRMHVHACVQMPLLDRKRVLKSLESGEVVSCMMVVVGGNQTQVLLKSIRFTPVNPSVPVPPAQVIVYQDFSKINPLKEKY